MRLLEHPWVSAGCLLALASGSIAQTAPTTGVLQVTARVESGCRVTGQAQVSGVEFGEMDFATHPSLFRQPLTAQAQLAANAVQLQCVGVTSAYVTIDGGLHAHGHQRRLASGAQYVPYELFFDSAGLEPFAIDTPRGVPISASGAMAIIELPVYGRVPPAIDSYSPGHYQDRVQVTVSW